MKYIIKCEKCDHEYEDTHALMWMLVNCGDLLACTNCKAVGTIRAHTEGGALVNMPWMKRVSVQ